MSLKDHISKIEKLINEKKINLLKIKYYPFYTISNDHQIILNENNNPLLKKIVSNNNFFLNCYNEIGCSDTFLRISIEDNSNNNEKNKNNEKNNDNNVDKLYFRKEQYIFRIKRESIKQNDGLFIIDAYNLIDIDEFPYLAKYDHNYTYKNKVFEMLEGKINLVNVEIINNNQNNNNSNKYFELNTMIDISNIEYEINSFIDNIAIIFNIDKKAI